MFEGFTSFDIDVGEAVIHGVTGGKGPPLLLLHGYPQTHAMWHKVAPYLAPHFTIVAGVRPVVQAAFGDRARQLFQARHGGRYGDGDGTSGP